MPGSIDIWFATSNDHKFEEAGFALKRFNLALGRLLTKGSEVQSDDVEVIARMAAAEAFRRSTKPLFVEDTGLFVAALNGFPGPYASYVNRTIGPSSLLTLLKGVRRREAEFVSVVAFCEKPGEVRTFTGRLEGRISDEARGTNGFGFDPVFIPVAENRTLGEMSLEEKSSVSHRSMALVALGTWLVSHWSR